MTTPWSITSDKFSIALIAHRDGSEKTLRFTFQRFRGVGGHNFDQFAYLPVFSIYIFLFCFVFFFLFVPPAPEVETYYDHCGVAI